MDLLRLLGLRTPKPKKRAVNLAFEYGTHLPVLKAVVEVFQPRGVLELGAGKFSTPLFYRHVKKVITVETDETWIHEVGKLVQPREGFALIHHRVPRLTSKTRARAISQGTKNECVKYYEGIIDRHPELDFLFIDHVSGLRSWTLFHLYTRFDFIVYHDAEEKGHGYERFSDFDNGEYFHYVLRAYIPHTGILIRKRFSPSMAEFQRCLDNNALGYFKAQYRFELDDLTKGQLPAIEERGSPNP
jgi:hypothetical protein